ncbi:MAG: vitamin B12 dependent methionine synthase, activation domain protein [Clostridiales bacterium]|nr:vitamin B12 dependent methionine synthase, activation domain protein [Clostridiales bacterium]
MLHPKLEHINPNEVLLYLGYNGGDVPPELEADIAACAQRILETARPRLTYRVFPLDGGRLRGTDFALEGQDIQTLLAGCGEAVLMAATLGPDVETLLMRAQVTDMAKALILDSCASTAIENVCDNFEADLRRDYAARGLYLTDRFSPGYGDLPIAQQRGFCELLDTRRRIGLTVSQSGILIPRKSVTAVLGAADSPRPHREPSCADCGLFRSCQMRRNGKVCGKRNNN